MTVDREARTAYIHDGGRYGKGIAKASIDGDAVLDFLHRREVNHLVVSCSHPHADHAGGLRAIVEDPAIRSFSSVDFVDAGYPEEDSLFKLFRRTHGSGPDVPTSRHVSALGLDGFAQLDLTSGNVRVSNFAYDAPGGSGPHGRSMITHFTVSREGVSQTLVDFDDASDELVRRWSESAPEEIRVRGDYTALFPHHGSSRSDLSPVFDLPNKPRAVIFSVNGDNRFMHPGPDSLRASIEAVGVDNVHVTGAHGNLHFTPEGLETTLSPAQRRQAVASFLNRQAEYAERRMRILDERRVAPNSDAYRRLGRYRDGFARLANEFDQTTRHMSSLSAPLHTPGVQLMSSSSHVTASASNVGDFAQLAAQMTESMVSSGSGGGRSISRGRSFTRALRGRPVFGGIIIGNVAANGSDQPSGIRFALLEIPGDPEFDLEPYLQPQIFISIKGKEGEEFVFDEMTPTEFWSAYYYVSPPAAWREKYNLGDNSFGLVGITENQFYQWTFGLHPSIANTLLARDGMRLDMFLSALGSMNEDELSPPFRGLQSAIDELDFTTYQWFDAPALIQARDGRIHLASSRQPSSILLRLRLVGMDESALPNWVGDEDLMIAELASRMQRRSLAVNDANIERVLGEMMEEVERRSENAFRTLSFDESEYLPSIAAGFDAFRRIERFARIVAVLNWVKESGITLPPFPDALTVNRLEVEPVWQMDQVLP